MCVQYIGGCSVHQGDTMSTSGGYHQYIEGISSVHRGMFSTLGGIMMHVGDTMSTSGGYHEYIGGCSVHWRMFSTSGFSIEIERFLQTCSPTCIMISSRCTHGIPLMYSWYPPDVLMISPRCTEHPTMY